MPRSFVHPVAIPEWTRDHRRLPAHTLCLAHVKHNGRRRCLAVPEAEAEAHLVQLDRFAAQIERIRAKHHELEAQRPRPRGKGPKRIKPAWPVSRFHHHRPGSSCLSPRPIGSTATFAEPDWFECAVTHGYMHEHRTKRGRRFLVAHIQGEASCPLTIARLAAEAAATEGEAA